MKKCIMLYLFQLYMDIPIYTEEPSMSRISVLVQRQRQILQSSVKDDHLDDKYKYKVISQDMTTYSRSFYFTISSVNFTSSDVSPPGNFFECRL